MIEASGTSGVGVYVEFNYQEHFLTSNIEYYAKDENCNYKWVPSSKGEHLKDAVEYKSGPYTFYMGRAFLHGSMQVGKVTLEAGTMYYAFGGKHNKVDSYEVLICKKNLMN